MAVPTRLFLGIVMMVGGAWALPAPTVAQQSDCDAYSSAATAQFALQESPGLAPALDPDGNGIACDHQAAGNTAPPAGGLQLPGMQAETPVSNVPAGATIDVIDQQPADTTTMTSAPTAPTPHRRPAGEFARRAAGRQPGRVRDRAWRSGRDDSQRGHPGGRPARLPPPPTAVDLYTIDVNDQVAVVVVTAESSWNPQQAATMISPYLPADVTDLPNPELLPDGTQLISVYSDELASGVTAEAMGRAGIPGVPGDLYLLLFPDDAGGIVELEIGLGNGDDLRAGAQPAG